MKVIHGLSLVSEEGLDVALETPHPAERVVMEVSGDSFSVDFALPRRQCRELRDWLSAVIDD